jgi:DNA-binding transcriptional LysR family regulator
MATTLADEESASWVRRLNMRHLQWLASVAHLGSISDAARAAQTTQPALSKWLKELEDEIGAPLFDRHPRGLSLTSHGRVLLLHVQRVLNEMGRAQYSIGAMQKGSSRRVMLGTSPPQAPDVTPAAMAGFLHMHPKATVKLVEGTMRVLRDKLLQGELDVVIGGLEDDEPDASLSSEVLHDESISIVARPGHPLSSHPSPDWDALHAYDWVVWPLGTPIRSKLDQALARANAGPLAYRIESSSLTANFSLVQQSDMLCAVSSRLARHFIRQQQVVRLPVDVGVDSVVGMYWRNEPLQATSTLDMLQCLRQAALHTA